MTEVPMYFFKRNRKAILLLDISSYNLILLFYNNNK